MKNEWGDGVNLDPKPDQTRSQVLDADLYFTQR